MALNDIAKHLGLEFNWQDNYQTTDPLTACARKKLGDNTKVLTSEERNLMKMGLHGHAYGMGREPFLKTIKNYKEANVSWLN